MFFWTQRKLVELEEDDEDGVEAGNDNGAPPLEKYKYAPPPTQGEGARLASRLNGS